MFIHDLIQKNLKCDRQESEHIFFSFTFFFCLMASYYILQPLRDEVGVLLGDTPTLFLWTMGVMFAVNPIFSVVMGKIPRPRLVPVIYRFFMLNLVLFILGFKWIGAAQGEASVQGTARLIPSIFFVWVSVFNLFAMSLFWSVMADRFTGSQGRKFFGFIGAGGTLGQLVGSTSAALLVKSLGATNLIFVSVVLLELSVRARPSLEDLTTEKAASSKEPQGSGDQPAKPKPWTGVMLVLKSPYIFGICCYLLLYAFTSSFIYFQKQMVVGDVFKTREDRVAFFGWMNFISSGGTLLVQLFVTGRLISSMGLIFSLSLVPAFTCLGFVALALQPGLILLSLFDAFRKMLNFAIARPSREILFTVVSKEDKYIAKNFVDTFVYRAGDSLASFAFTGITRLNLGGQAYSWTAVPFSCLWVAVAALLARAQRTKQEAQEAALAQATPAPEESAGLSDQPTGGS
ncbi:hypothetical protein JST97_33430 [bacterium]|nr:hypothetical protein [bacterium]